MECLRRRGIRPLTSPWVLGRGGRWAGPTTLFRRFSVPCRATVQRGGDREVPPGLVGSPPWPYTSQTSMLVSCKDRHRQARACDQVRTWQGASGGTLHDSQPRDMLMAGGRPSTIVATQPGV